MNKLKKLTPDFVEKSFSEVYVEDSTLEEQKDLYQHDPERHQKINHADRNMKMKERWSLILGGYLSVFTLLIFLTLWFHGRWRISFLESTTLNFLITVGFVKVMAVIWVIVNHLFPKK